MPRFSECCSGADMYICQKCGRDLCSACKPPQWRPDITGHKEAGNVCPSCLQKHENQPMSLYEHCKEESGLTDPAKIWAYMQRHYGHG